MTWFVLAFIVFTTWSILAYWGVTVIADLMVNIVMELSGGFG